MSPRASKPCSAIQFSGIASNGRGGEEGFSRLTEARLCLIAFLHDFGKLNVGFQFDVLGTSSGAPKKVHHIKAGLWACERMKVLEVLGLLGMAAWGAEALEEYLRAALAHHGIPARSSVSARGPDPIWRPFGDYDPIAGAELLARRGREWFPQAFETGLDLPRSPALAHLFAGVLTLADQLGSNEEFFPFCPTADPHYLEQARQRARRAMAESGFRRDGWADEATAADFATTGDYRRVFDFDCPRPLQRAVAGEFKWSSQHLKEELRWRQAGAEERIEPYVNGCVHQAVRQWDAASIGRGSGKRSLEVCRARRPPWQRVCPPLSGHAGFANVVVCHPSIFVPSRGAISRSLSEKRSPFFEPVVVACARSPGSWAAHLRRSRENCGGTRLHEEGTSSIEPRPLNGTPIGERAGQSFRSSLRTAN